MSEYRLSNVAKQDLIRIHQYGIKTCGMAQADKYFDSSFEHFEIIAKQPFSFESHYTRDNSTHPLASYLDLYLLKKRNGKWTILFEKTIEVS